MPQQLEDRIKDLCAKAVETPASPQLNEILMQLQASLSEHTQRMRKMVVGFSCGDNTTVQRQKLATKRRPEIQPRHDRVSAVTSPPPPPSR